MICLISVGVIIGMIYQAVLLYVYTNTDDEILEKLIISVEACSIFLFVLLALKGYIS